MSNQKTPEPTIDSFHVSKNHKFYQEWTDLFNRSEFQLIKFGCEKFQIPFQFVKNDYLIMGHPQNENTSPELKNCQFKTKIPNRNETINLDTIMEVLIQQFNLCLYAEKSQKRVAPRKKEIFAAYCRLSDVYHAKPKRPKSPSTPAEIIELWQCFEDLFIFCQFYWHFEGLTFQTSNKLTYALSFDAPDPFEPAGSYFDSEVPYKAWIEKFTLDFSSIFKTFDRFRVVYFNQNFVPSTTINPILCRLAEDYQKEADCYFCYLEFTHENRQIDLIVIKKREISYKTYSINPKSLLKLTSDIKSSIPRKDNMSDTQLRTLKDLVHDARATFTDQNVTDKIFGTKVIL